MYSQIPAPEKRLAKDAVKVWMIREIISNLIGLVVLGVLYYLSFKFAWKEWIVWILIGIIIILILAAIWSTFIRPYFLYKNWRYDVNADFLQLKYGAFNELHELIPMTKIQSVATNQGPILRKYGLYSISVETVASTHQIPGLPGDVAIELRGQIAYFAKIKEVE